MPKQHIGSHLSRSGGYYNALQDARSIGANCLQLYTNAPQRLTFAMDVLNNEQRADLAKAKQYLQHSHTTKDPMLLFIHSPYTINLCDTRKMTVNATVLRQQLEVCELAGGEGVVVHTGTQGKEQELHHAYETYVRTVRMAMHGFSGRSRVLVETCAGQGRSIGVKVEAFARLYNGFSREERERQMGVVIDTCHVFAAGYDISTADGVRAFCTEFHHHISPNDVRLIHLNDSKKACGTCVDRHAHLGEGFVFKSSTDALVQLFAMYASVPFVLETHDKKPYPTYATEIALCKELYGAPEAKKRTRKQKSACALGVRERVVSAFKELAEVYYSQQDNVRGDTYYEAAHSLDSLDTLDEIPSTRKELKAFRGIGDSIADKTIELLYTGRMRYLDRLRNDPSIQDKIRLLRVSGIGVKTYEQLVGKGITTLEQLKQAHADRTITLTHAQELGLVHYDDLQLRIPRKESHKLDVCLQKWCKQHPDGPTVQFVGSYRRKKPTSGDIDILLHRTTIDECIAHIQKQKKYEIVGFITHGQEKTSFLMRIDKHVRRVDVLVTTDESYVPALVYFTGSKFFNIRMRLTAKEKGYVLNEHGLCRAGGSGSGDGDEGGGEGKCVVLRTEGELFEVLGVGFVGVEGR